MYRLRFYLLLSHSSTWQPIKLVWTKSIVAFGKAGEKSLFDAVPLSDISEVTLMQDISGPASIGTSVGSNERGGDDSMKEASQNKSKAFAIPRKVRRMSSVGNNENPVKTPSAPPAASNNLLIVTEEDGYNSGRKYYIQANSEFERRQIIDNLTSVYKAAKKSKEFLSRHKRMKENLLQITTSDPFQYFFAMLILAVSLPDRSCRKSIIRKPSESKSGRAPVFR